MKFIEKYEIIKIYLDGIPKIPYADGIGGFRGVAAHSTANFGWGEQEDTAMSERNYEQNNWRSAFVHYFIDYSTILDIADNDYISYGCGSFGNKFYLNFELCQTKRADRFAESYDRWVWAMAYLLYSHKLGVIDGVTLVSHRWVSQNLGGTNHDDPHSYIESLGKTWANVVADVSDYYNKFENESESEIVKFTYDYQWDMLVQLLNDTYQMSVGGQLVPPLLSDYGWVEKSYNRTLTQDDLAWLTIVLFSKDKGIIKP